MKLTVIFPYKGFMLECVCSASEAEPQTHDEPGCNAEFIVEEIYLENKDAAELIGYDDWPLHTQIAFDQSVKQYHIDHSEDAS